MHPLSRERQHKHRESKYAAAVPTRSGSKAEQNRANQSRAEKSKAKQGMCTTESPAFSRYMHTCSEELCSDFIQRRWKPLRTSFRVRTTTSTCGVTRENKMSAPLLFHATCHARRTHEAWRRENKRDRSFVRAKQGIYPCKKMFRTNVRSTLGQSATHCRRPACLPACFSVSRPSSIHSMHEPFK